MKNEQIMHLKEERKGIVFCTNENLQQIKRRQENIFNSKQRERMKKSTGLYCLLLLCVCGVVFVCGDKGGWTCESDGWYYNNGKKSEWACDNGKDDKSKDDKGKDEVIVRRKKVRAQIPITLTCRPGTLVPVSTVHRTTTRDAGGRTCPMP